MIASMTSPWLHIAIWVEYLLKYRFCSAIPIWLSVIIGYVIIFDVSAVYLSEYFKPVPAII